MSFVPALTELKEAATAEMRCREDRWTLKQVNQGAHGGITGDVQQVIRNTEELAEKILELK